MTVPIAQPTDPFAWLPALVLFNAFGGNWQLYEDALYEHFRQDFIESEPAFPGRTWAVKRHPESKGKACTFWHIVSEGSDEDERLPDLRRCERIRWPRPMIDAHAQPSVRIWRNTRRRSNRVLIALHDFSYVVVLEDRRKYIMLWTAYHVEHAWQRQQMQKEYRAAGGRL